MSAVTYVSSTSFSVSGDYRDYIKPNQACLFDQGVDGEAQSSVASVAYGGGTTTVTINDSVLTSNLVDAKFGPTYADPASSDANLGVHFHTAADDGGFMEVSNLTSGQITFLQSLVTA